MQFKLSHHRSVGKESTCNAGDPSSSPGFGRSGGERIGYPLQYSWASLVTQLIEFACNAEDLGSIPRFRRLPGEGKGYPLQNSGLENSVDCIVDDIAKSQTRLSDFHFHCNLKEWILWYINCLSIKLLFSMFKFFKKIHLFLTTLGFHCCARAFSGGGKQGLQALGLQELWHGLSCSEACSIFLNWGLNLCLLYWQADS